MSNDTTIKRIILNIEQADWDKLAELAKKQSKPLKKKHVSDLIREAIAYILGKYKA